MLEGTFLATLDAVGRHQLEASKALTAPGVCALDEERIATDTLGGIAAERTTRA
jgi:hypothetical protein